MIAGRAFVTPHAVARWQARIHRGVSYEQARVEILDALAHSTLRRRDDATGVEHWRAGKRCPWGRVRIRMVRGLPGPLPSVLTVMPEWDEGGAR